MEKRCLKLNNRLPDNVCVNLYSISAFITYMEKMSHMWYAILTPELQPTDEVTWILGYMKQYVEERPYYILWLFIMIFGILAQKIYKPKTKSYNFNLYYKNFNKINI